jgi:hypothetical protein
MAMMHESSRWHALWSAALLLSAAAGLAAGEAGEKPKKSPQVPQMPERVGAWRLAGQRAVPPAVYRDSSGREFEAGPARAAADYIHEGETTPRAVVTVGGYPSGKDAKKALKADVDRYESAYRSEMVRGVGAEALAWTRPEKKKDPAGGEYYLLQEKKAGETGEKPSGALWLYRNRLVHMQVSAASGERGGVREFVSAFMPAAVRLWKK